MENHTKAKHLLLNHNCYNCDFYFKKFNNCMMLMIKEHVTKEKAILPRELICDNWNNEQQQ